MISGLPKFGLSALVGILIGGVLIMFAEPETAAGASLLGAIGLVPSLIVGHLLLKKDKSKQYSKKSASKKT